jgi:hypothetical protein
MNATPEDKAKEKEITREMARGFFSVLLPYYAVLFAAIFLDLGINEGRLLNHPDYGGLVAAVLIFAGLGAVWLHFKYHLGPMQKWLDLKNRK